MFVAMQAMLRLGLVGRGAGDRAVACHHGAMGRPPKEFRAMRSWHRWMWIALTACRPMMQGSPPGPPEPVETAEPPPAMAEVAEAPDGPAAGAEEAFALADAEPAKASRGAPGGDAALWVDAHNRLRAKHCAGGLSWSAKLAQVAQHWANSLRDQGCAFGHSNGSYGENLAAGTSGALDPGSVVQMWYDEVGQYRFPDGGFSMKTGHFTQLVWRGTHQVGCGRSQCKDKGMDIFVCEYDPPGNWEGKYRENVLPRGCK
jgi:uncharacterized protein YkwD